jgi:hypothetical protein
MSNNQLRKDQDATIIGVWLLYDILLEKLYIFHALSINCQETTLVHVEIVRVNALDHELIHVDASHEKISRFHRLLHALINLTPDSHAVISLQEKLNITHVLLVYHEPLLIRNVHNTGAV